jgi:hypothetical protein
MPNDDAARDANSRDAEVSDAEVPDEETSDEETPDAGARDAGARDAGAPDTEASDALARYAGPEYRRLLDAARGSLERTGGDLSRTVTVKSPDDGERRAIIGITGQYRPEGVGVLAVRMGDVGQNLP